MYERGPLSVRLSLQLARASYPEGGACRAPAAVRWVLLHACRATRDPAPRLDLLDQLQRHRQFHPLLRLDEHPQPKPFKSDIVRVNYANGAPTTSRRSSRWSSRYEERILSGGVRFRFGRRQAPAPAAPPAAATAAAAGRRAAAPPPPPPPPPPAPTDAANAGSKTSRMGGPSAAARLSPCRARAGWRA